MLVFAGYSDRFGLFYDIASRTIRLLWGARSRLGWGIEHLRRRFKVVSRVAYRLGLVLWVMGMIAQSVVCIYVLHFKILRMAGDALNVDWWRFGESGKP
jgi:hypothetical protein